MMKFNFGHRLIHFIVLMVLAHVAVAAPHPNMYLNQAEIDAINSKVSDNVEPWRSAYNKVISAADSALDRSLLSVTFEGKTTNQYYTEKPYCGWPPTSQYPNGCRDGRINDKADRKDYTAAIALGDRVRDLGLAYAFTGEAKYADKAIDFIRTWSLNPATRMTPTTAAGNRIELFITLPGYFYGADLIWNYDGWDAGEKVAFASWVKKIGDHAKDKKAGINNFANWRVVLIASAGALLDDNTLLSYAATEWKRLLPIQMNNRGSKWAGRLGQESSRTKGLHYSLYAINAMIQGAEILRHRNVNLYDYRAEKGESLELALDFITPFALDPASWELAGEGYQQITAITQRDSMALYELAYTHYQKQSYLDAITRWGRPMDETRVMGITTLTHVDLELSVDPIPPSITSQPESIMVTEGEDATFSIVATGSGSLIYQWYFNGGAIESTNSASYILTDVSAADAGTYGCIVTNDQGSDSCVDATLEVLADVLAPTLVTASATSATAVDLLFSEPVSVASAENSANYQLDRGINIDTASLNADERTVSLTVSPALTEDSTYEVSVSNVQDRAQTPNTIVNLSSKTFTYRTIYTFDGVNPTDDWTPLNSGNWEVKTDAGDMAYYINSSSSPGNSLLGEYSLLPGSYGDFTLTAQARLDANGANTDYAVVFGFQDADNYYYALFNNNQAFTELFKVFEGTRTALDLVDPVDTDWLNDNAYHAIKVSREGSEIKVYFDDNLIMHASDSTFGVGQVGVGSFNDSAYFDDVQVVGEVTAIVDDTTPPVILLNGSSPVTIDEGDVYIDAGATATDNNDDNTQLTQNIAVVNPVDTNSPATYTVTYNVSDAAKNAATQVTRTVIVTAAATNNPGDSDSGGGAFGALLGLGLMLLAIRRRLTKGHQ